MNRRDALKVLALATAMRCSAAEPTKQQPLGLVIHSYWIRRDRPLSPDFDSVAEPLAFLEAAARIGARGIQTKVSGLEAASLAKLRDALEQREMYVEGTIGLPKDQADIARFEAEVLSSKQAGATVLRTGCMSVPARELAEMLARVRRHKHPQPLPTIASLSQRLSEKPVARPLVGRRILNERQFRR